MKILKKVIQTSSLIIILTTCASFSSEEKLLSSNTALLVIDVQNAYLPVYNNNSFLNNIQTLVKQARETDVPIIYIRNLGGFNDPGTFGWKFHEKIMAGEDDYIVEKKRPSSFYQTDLKALLDELQIENLVLTGLASSGCYGATASDAVMKKYNTYIVRDAHSDRGKASVDALNNRFADYDYVIMTETENVMFASASSKK